MIQSALILLADGFEPIETVTPIDVLRRAGIAVTLAGIGKTTIEGGHGITLEADCILKTGMPVPDVLILPGGMPGAVHLGASPEARAMAEATVKAGKICAALCAAPAKTLAAWGMLDNRRATCYPGCEQDFPSTATALTDPVVVDLPFVTSRGPGTALAFSLALVGLLQGEDAADALAGRMLASR